MFFLKPKIFPTKFHPDHIEICISSYSDGYILYTGSKKFTIHEH